MDRAITVAQQAVDATPHDHPDRAVDLSNLGIALQHQFEARWDVKTWTGRSRSSKSQ